MPVSLMMVIFAPVCADMLRMFSPPLPIILPSCPCAGISVVLMPDGAGWLASSRTSCKSVLATSHPDASPVICTRLFVLSTCMRTPLSSCNRRIVSPPRPIILPKHSGSTGMKISTAFGSRAPDAEDVTGARCGGGAMSSFTMRTACATRSGAPVTVILRG